MSDKDKDAIFLLLYLLEEGKEPKDCTYECRAYAPQLGDSTWANSTRYTKFYKCYANCSSATSQSYTEKLIDDFETPQKIIANNGYYNPETKQCVIANQCLTTSTDILIK